MSNLILDLFQASLERSDGIPMGSPVVFGHDFKSIYIYKSRFGGGGAAVYTENILSVRMIGPPARRGVGDLI